MRTETTNSEWVSLLKHFTHKHAGRRTRLEFDDPEIGAQWSEVDFPLRGVAYDRRDNRIEIMLGEAGSLEAHLSHSVQYPISLEIMQPLGAPHEALRIIHDRGQIVLQFV
jgi:hypothetical protein